MVEGMRDSQSPSRHPNYCDFRSEHDGKFKKCQTCMLLNLNRSFALKGLRTLIVMKFISF